MSCCAHIECYFRPFASVHAQWIAASVHSDSCNAEMLCAVFRFAKKKKEVPEKARLAQKSKDAVFFFVPVSFLCEKKKQNQEGAKLSSYGIIPFIYTWSFTILIMDLFA